MTAPAAEKIMASITSSAVPMAAPVGAEHVLRSALAISGTAVSPPVDVKAGQLIMLAWVPDAEIPAEHRAFVQGRADQAARLAGLAGGMHVRFFRYTTGPGDLAFRAVNDNEMVAGACNVEQTGPNTIAIDATLRGELLLAAIAHEVRHVAQQTLLALLQDPAFIERDADRFMLACLEEYPACE